jgi:hypothetical protein
MLNRRGIKFALLSEEQAKTHEYFGDMSDRTLKRTTHSMASN